MALPYFPLFIDVLDAGLDGLYNSFSSQTKVPTLASVRDKGLYLSVTGLQTNTGGTTPWSNIDLSTATVSASIDAPDLFPSQGSFFLASGSTSAALAYNIGPSNLGTALNALTTISGAGGLTVTQEGEDFICTWNTNGAQPLVTASSGSLYPASKVTITELQKGTSNLPEIQSISIEQLPATLQTVFTPVSYSGYTAMQGELSLATPGMLARFDSLPPGTQSFAATLQVDVQFPGQDPQTILTLPVTVMRDVIKNGIGAVPIFSTPATEAFVNAGFVHSWFATIIALSSGAGTLSGIATANSATALGTSGQFLVSGITTGWFLRAGTDATSAGIQRPDDYNASTNAVVWQQYL